MSRILLAGATGLVGAAVLDILLDDERVGSVVALVRGPLPVQHPKLEQWQAGEELLDGLKSGTVDGVICCLGTTIRNVGGDRRKFTHVDKDLVVELSKWAKMHGDGRFAVVSAVGADPASRVFYNRVKGEMEREVGSIGLRGLHIFHPSILTGPRREVRTGERIGIAFMKVIAPVLPARYRPMPHKVLARALVIAALSDATGVHRYMHDGIMELAGIRS
jgi:uncharacterized protein YbjT (DUF2867 family)